MTMEGDGNDGGRRRAATFVFLALVAIIAIPVLFLMVGSARRGTFSARYSSYRTTPDGTKAFFATLSRRGFRPIRENKELLQLGEGGLLIIVEPVRTGIFSLSIFSDREVRSVTDWIRKGGILLLMTSRPNELLSTLQVDLEEAEAAEEATRETGEETAGGPARASQPTRYTRGTMELELASEAFFKPRRWDYAMLFSRDEKPRVLVLREGLGKAILVADPYPATNRGLRKGRNLTFLMNIIRAHGETGGVRFDEYHHGFGEERSILGYVRARSLHFALFQGLLVFALLVWFAGSREGKPREFREEVSIESREYVKAMANIYAKAGMRRYAARWLLGHFRRSVRETLGLRGRTTKQSLAAELKSVGGRRDRTLEGIFRRYRQLMREKRPGEHALLTFSREVTRFESDLREAVKSRVKRRK
jgi:hypothetical protein